MTATQTNTNALSDFLKGYTAEVTAGDKKSIVAAKKMMVPNSEVFIASLPKDTADKQIAAAVKVREAGMIPVPHIVARNIKNLAELDDLLGRLAKEANVDHALILAGDRDDPVGDFDSSLQLIETGLIQKHGIKKIYIAWYPEGHPRVADEVLETARADKLVAIEKAGLEVELVSQFCFDAPPIIEQAKRMRAKGVTVPFRVGVAGPANRTTLVKYAIVCGVGASLRALKERQSMAKNMLTGETPEALISELVAAQAENPELGLSGVHFFTFGSLEKSAKFAQGLIK